jgi:hypothetical protein
MAEANNGSSLEPAAAKKFNGHADGGESSIRPFGGSPCERHNAVRDSRVAPFSAGLRTRGAV